MTALITRRRGTAAKALAACAAIGVSPAGAQQREVKIGFVLPLSGGTATNGNQTKVGAEIAIEQIIAVGAIGTIGGARLVPVFGDSHSEPDFGVAEAERLSTRQQASVFVGEYNSAVTFPATELADR